MLTALMVFAVEQNMMSVQVKKSQLRATPSFLGKIVAAVSYGNHLEVRSQKGAWYRISLPGTEIQGWMHASALTRKRIVLKAGASDVTQTATMDEIALAGKGFNKEVEGEFRAQNPNLDFTWIDRMEKIVVSQNQIQQFLNDGDLAPQGGSE
jgi:hypothetical protein